MENRACRGASGRCGEEQKEGKKKTEEEPKKYNEKDDGRKKVRLHKQAERRSRSKEDS